MYYALTNFCGSMRNMVPFAILATAVDAHNRAYTRAFSPLAGPSRTTVGWGVALMRSPNKNLVCLNQFDTEDGSVHNLGDGRRRTQPRINPKLLAPRWSVPGVALIWRPN